MYTKYEIYEIIKDVLDKKQIFIVDIKVETNSIIVLIDSFFGATIDDCSEITSTIGKKLGDDMKNVNLTVSSPGIDIPFVVLDQYRKNMNREVEVTLYSGKKLKGYLIGVGAESITINVEEAVRFGNKKQKVINKYILQFNEIKHTKEVVSF